MRGLSSSKTTSVALRFRFRWTSIIPFSLHILSMDRGSCYATSRRFKFLPPMPRQNHAVPSFSASLSAVAGNCWRMFFILTAAYAVA